MKTGTIVITNFSLSAKINGQRWEVVGKDFSNRDCVCLKHLNTGKFLTINKSWVRRQKIGARDQLRTTARITPAKKTRPA